MFFFWSLSRLDFDSDDVQLHLSNETCDIGHRALGIVFEVEMV